jgi:uncharacterized protein (DUF2267 family)
MNELIQQITQQTGISESQARQAVQIVGNFLKQRLPGSAASQVDNFLSGQGGQGGIGGTVGQDIGGMFGGDQPTTNRP